MTGNPFPSKKTERWGFAGGPNAEPCISRFQSTLPDTFFTALAMDFLPPLLGTARCSPFSRFRSLSAARFYFAALGFAATAIAQEQSEVELTLDEAISTAIESNLGLQVERYEPLIQAEEVTIEEAAFDPVAFANMRYSEESQESRNSTSDQRSYTAGVRKRIITGTEVSLSTSLSRNDGTFYSSELGQVVGGNLSENADIALSITQPLLQGFGIDVTRAQLRRAESLDRATRLQLRQVVLDVLAETELAYWQVADADARRRLGESNRELARRLLEEIQERRSLGLATELEVLQAEANLAQREQEIIAADQLLSERIDALLALLGNLREVEDVDPRVDVALLPRIDSALPEFSDVWRTALARNPDTAIQEELIEQRRLEVLLARDATRPQLDLTLSGGYNGLSNESGTDAYEEALARDGHEWGLQIAFNYPFGRRASRAGLRQAEYRIEQAEWQLIAIKQNLLQETRSAWRDLDVARRQVDAARTVVRLQEATFEQERGEYEEGLSTIRDVLETQRDLDQARTSLLDALYNAIAAEVRLERQQGLLLERHQLEWTAIAPESFNPAPPND